MESIEIGEYSFRDLAGDFELKNLPQLQSIQIGTLGSKSYNFGIIHFRYDILLWYWIFVWLNLPNLPNVNYPLSFTRVQSISIPSLDCLMDFTPTLRNDFSSIFTNLFPILSTNLSIYFVLSSHSIRFNLNHSCVVVKENNIKSL